MIHPSVRICPTAHIDCADLSIGAGGVVGSMCILEGRKIVIGREAWLDDGAHIGGGSCHDPMAFLNAGDHLHMGRHSHINTARGVTIGDECGLGRFTAIYSHGAYLSELDGFPVSFAPVVVGSRVWLPQATVLPGVTIGSDVVVGAMSLVNYDLPSGCLAGGVPAKVLRLHAFPGALADARRAVILDSIIDECRAIVPSADIGRDRGLIEMAPSVARGKQTTTFDTVARTIKGAATPEAEAVRNQLRRHGIRFRYSPGTVEYEPWT